MTRYKGKITKIRNTVKILALFLTLDTIIENNFVSLLEL